MLSSKQGQSWKVLYTECCTLDTHRRLINFKINFKNFPLPVSPVSKTGDQAQAYVPRILLNSVEEQARAQ
jgi:hypothetical protein